MKLEFRGVGWSVVAAVLLLGARFAGGETFRIGTYNVENYLDRVGEGRQPKSAAAKAKVRESILALKPDILALQEMGSVSALLELRDSLKAEGLDLPYWEHVAGPDTNIHVAVLSRFPFTARYPHTNDNFLLSGRRFRVSRGFAEVDIQVNSNYCLTLLAAHLKSRRPIPQADEAELRLEEAKLLREKVDARLAANPNANLVVVGDFNDNKDSASTKAVIGRYRNKLVDIRPAERNGDDAPSADSKREPRKITWTHFYEKEDSYSRIDFILVSPGLARESVREESFIPAVANWGVGSDHRPIGAGFEPSDR